MRPRFTVLLPEHREHYSFFSLPGARQWIQNEREEGRIRGEAKIYDNETNQYVDE